MAHLQSRRATKWLIGTFYEGLLAPKYFHQLFAFFRSKMATCCFRFYAQVGERENQIFCHEIFDRHVVCVTTRQNWHKTGETKSSQLLFSRAPNVGGTPLSGITAAKRHSLLAEPVGLVALANKSPLWHCICIPISPFAPPASCWRLIMTRRSNVCWVLVVYWGADSYWDSSFTRIFRLVSQMVAIVKWFDRIKFYHYATISGYTN